MFEAAINPVPMLDEENAKAVISEIPGYPVQSTEEKIFKRKTC
jgi:hypothetical protein